jgi:hypothetical protein
LILSTDLAAFMPQKLVFSSRPIWAMSPQKWFRERVFNDLTCL